jgi:hypothetical protein
MCVDRMSIDCDRPKPPNHQPVGAGLEIDSTAAITHRPKPALPTSNRSIAPNHQPVGAGLEIDPTAAITHRTKPALPTNNRSIVPNSLVQTDRGLLVRLGAIGTIDRLLVRSDRVVIGTIGRVLCGIGGYHMDYWLS